MVTVVPREEFVATSWTDPEFRMLGTSPTLIVRWDRSEGAFWVLRLCERFGNASGMWGYPPATRWNVQGTSGLGYSDHPVTADGSARGRCSAEVAAEGDMLRFRIVLRNESSDSWLDAWAWVCLIHRWARSFQANCELPTGTGEDPWTPCACLHAPMTRWLKWCAVRGWRETAERIAFNHRNMWQPHIEAAFGTVRAWTVALDRPVRQFVRLASDDAVILGWSHWPCTDMALYFGDIEPGEERTSNGTLSFLEETYLPT